MDICRKELMLQSGFLSLALKEKWHGPVASQIVVYLRPIPLLSKYEVKTTIEMADENSVYMKHIFWMDGKKCAEGNVRCTVKKGRDTISPIEVVRTLNLQPLNTERNIGLKNLDEIDSHVRTSSKSPG